jgi:uroporphyrinogen decarboxylase
MKQAGGNVIGVDWRVNLGEAWARLGYDVAVQGNLDPVILLGSADHIEKEVKRILNEAGNRPGHIFNLGHGILPNTPVDNVTALIEAVHRYSLKSAPY